MNYLAAAITDKGNKKSVNQDAVLIRNKVTGLGNICICAVCDGMGGLNQGEVASSHVIRRLSEWFLYRSSKINRFEKWIFYLEKELQDISREIFDYGKKMGFAVGTTATVLLICNGRYAIVHVGDSRAYLLDRKFTLKMWQLTNDHSVNDYMLTQAIGTDEKIKPQVIRGKVSKKEAFLLCSDGFRHKNSINDMKKGLDPKKLEDTQTIEKKLRIYVDRARSLGETDDITVALVKNV